MLIICIIYLWPVVMSQVLDSIDLQTSTNQMALPADWQTSSYMHLLLSPSHNPGTQQGTSPAK